MRIYVMTDLEGVAGVRDFQQWTSPGLPYYDLARTLLTQELNAAIAGLFAGGATSILVADGHGPSAVDIVQLDPRVELLRGWGRGWPLGLEDGGFDCIATVGQHAKARTEFSNMAHTQGCSYLELSVNGVAIGEFGQFAMCASELGARAIFAAGELAFAKEAEALVPGIETVWGKRGTKPGRGDECSEEEYRARNGGAIHLHPEKVREMIRDGAERAARRAARDKFGLIPMTPPYRRVCVLRHSKEKNLPRRYSVEEHPSSFAALMNMPFNFKPVESDAQLKSLLVE
jgi:D-amino peptidase